MIKDKLVNIKKYTLNEHFELFKEKIEEAIQYPEKLEAPLKAIPLEYETKDFNYSKFENHERHIDIHYVIKGSECIGINALKDLRANMAYVKEGDYQLFDGKAKELIVLEEGEFLLLFPGEAHVTGGLHKGTKRVSKIVFKIPV